MKRTSKISFEQEEANTKFFLEKLNEIKQKSKNLKTKNTLPLHKSLFISDWQVFEREE